MMKSNKLTSYLNKINFSSVFSKTALKIALIVAIMFTALLVLLNYFIVKQSENAFLDVIESIQVEPIEAQVFVDEQGNINFIPGQKILRFTLNGDERQKPLQQVFTDNFQSSILWVGLLGIITSLLIGLIAANLFTSPLQKLCTGINNLRKNNYKFTLSKTGTEEVDTVIEEFNHLTKELQIMEELRQDLISDTSHELKTPLTSLSTQLEAVKDGVLKLDNKRASLLLDQVGRLNHLVESLQEFTRLRNKKYKMKLEEFSFPKFVEDMIEINKISIEKTGFKTEVDIPKKSTLFADRTMLERVFDNLIQNALKYSGGNRIKIYTNGKDIIFEDNGNGVPPKEIDYLYERFYRVEKSRNRKTGGLGIGLSIVKEIVEAHGWRIKVENIKGKNGLRFTIKTQT